MERDPKDNKVTFAEFDGTDIDVQTPEDVALLLACLGDAAGALTLKYGHVVYPVFRTYNT